MTHWPSQLCRQVSEEVHVEPTGGPSCLRAIVTPVRRREVVGASGKGRGKCGRTCCSWQQLSWAQGASSRTFQICASEQLEQIIRQKE